jgi:small GTP-binding protein
MNSFKIIFWGAAGSGKTSIVSRATKNKFDELHNPTIGANFSSKDISDDRLQFWDLAGDRLYIAMSRIFCRDSKALVYCIDLTQELNEAQIKADLDDYRGLAPGALVILVGTKSDLPNQKVTAERLAAFAVEHQAKAHFITSAKSNDNIEALFNEIARLARKHFPPAANVEGLQPVATIATSMSLREEQGVAPDPRYARILGKLPIDSALYISLDGLFKELHKLPPAKRDAIVSAADTLVTALENPSDVQAKSAAITTFKTDCDKVVRLSRCQIIVKAIEVVAIAAVFTLIAAMIGFVCGAWMGPLALITGLLGASAAAIAVVASSGAVGVAAGGFAAYRLFKPSPLSSSLIDKVVEKAKDFEPPFLPEVI